MFSLAGAAFSLAVMVFLKKKGDFSPGGVSVAGGVAHNVGQILVAVFAVENINLFYYLPFLLIAGLAAGFLMGILAGEVLKRINRKDFL